jgi:asparagine N-glycosylation enzyme membrane subunit Stt3
LPTLVVAVGAAILVSLSLLITTRGRLVTSLGDTDDALRLVLVRDLLSGRAGWFDLHMARLNPPQGLDIHWSRLIDGGLAILYRLFDLALSPAEAELAMRAVWPLLWTAPAIAAVIAIARRMGGQAAVLPAALLMVMNALFFMQWVPGRIDHHNVQITLALIAVAGAVQGRRGGAIAAGIATALALAVGLEALVFLALAGASFALLFLFDPARRARPALAYAASLAAALSLAYLVQTDPARLARSACDAVGMNLWAGVIVACLALAATVRLTAGRSFAVRFVGLGGVGVAAAAAYLVLDPSCLRGPFADLDPRLHTVWLDHVAEMAPLLGDFSAKRSSYVVCSLLLAVFGAASWLWLGRRREARNPAWLLMGACLVTGFVLGLGAERMSHYPNWFAAPLIAAALGDLTERVWKGSLLPAAVVLALTSQPLLVKALDAIPGWRTDSAADLAADRCNDSAAYAPLAALPPGEVLAEVDFGPRILALSPHTAVSAPYHRIGAAILAGQDALAARPGADEAAVRKLGATYLMTCAGKRHARLDPQSLQRRLDRGEAPTWLEPLSVRSVPLQLYRVRPLSGDRAVAE